MASLRSSFCAVVSAATLIFGAITLPAHAGDRADALETLAGAVSTVEDLRDDHNFVDNFAGVLDRARAVLVIPSFYKGAFLVGGSYGNAVLMVRNNAGQWSPPAFYRVAGGSIGLQIGGQSAHMLFMIMSSNGLDAILNDRFKIGANLGVTFIDVGGNMEAATTSNMNQDIIAFANASGAFGGASIDGSAITQRDDWDEALYGDNATPKSILFDRRYPMPDLANSLAGALSRHGNGAPATQPQTQAQQPVQNNGQQSAPIDNGGDQGTTPPPATDPAASQGTTTPTPLTPMQKQPLN